MRVRFFVALLLTVGLVGAIRYWQRQSIVGEFERRQQPLWGEMESEYRPMRVLDPQPPIVEPPSVAAEQAEGQIGPSELVLGVEVGGQARAYPINMLTGPQREIFNDVLGDERIAATW